MLPVGEPEWRPSESIDALKGSGTGFVVARLKDPMRKVFDDARLTDRIGEDHFYPTVRDAVAAVSSV